MKKFVKLIPWICLAVILALCVVLLCNCNRNDTPQTEDPTNINNGPCTVVFDLNGTELKTTTVQPQTVKGGALLREPEVFVIGENPDNWYIKGWFTEPECQNEWDFDIDIVEQSMTLYARWVDDPQRTVTYYAGRNTESLQPVHTARVSLGLNAEKCDDRVLGYEVLGYYADAGFEMPYDFDTPIHEDINIYIKTSDYIYISPKQLSIFSMTNVTSALAVDGSEIVLDYSAEPVGDGRYTGVNFIYTKSIPLVLNGYDHLEMVYKLENANRADIYWYGTHSNGASVKGRNDFSAELMNVGLKEFGTTIWTDDEGWTHAVYDLTRVAKYYHEDAPRLVDVAVINGLRIDVDGETAETAKLTVKYIKGSHGPAGSNITYYVGGAVKADEFVPLGETPKGYPELGRRVYYYSDAACTKPYDISKAPGSDINLYLKIDTTHIYFDGVQLSNFSPAAGAEINVNSSANLSFNGKNGAFIHHKQLQLDLKGDNTLEVKAKLDGCIPGMFIYGVYTINGKTGYSTDYGQKYTNLTSILQITDAGDGWSIITVDLTKVTAGFQMLAIDGLRLDIFGTEKYNTEIEYVRSYRTNKHDVTLNVDGEIYIEAVNDGRLVAGAAFLGRNLAYYTDAEMTQPFDPLTPITEAITLYVKILDHLYFDGPGLALFEPQAGADTYGNLNGELVMYGSNGAFIHKKELALEMNGDNLLKIRAKLDGATPGIFIFGKYTVGGGSGESTDYGQLYTRIPTEAITVEADGLWSILTIDLTQVAPGFRLEVLNGLRFDLYGNEDYIVVIDYIKSDYVLKHTVTLINGDVKSTYDVMDGDKITSVGPLGRKVEYFTDKACTAAFDVNTPITADTTVYVKLGTHIYFDGNSLNRLNIVGGTGTLLADGTLRLTGPNGTFIHKKDLNLAMNGDNMLEIRLKTSAGSSYGVFVYGKYTLAGVKGESTDYGQDYTRIPAEAITTKADGEWTVLTIDFSKVAEGYVLTTINGLRMDIYGSSNANYTHTYDTVTSYRTEKCMVTYKGDVNKTESVEKGQPISGSAILGRKVEYFTDEACTTAFNVTTPVTSDTTIYVKLGTHVYFDGMQLNGFNKVGDPVPTVILNSDKSLTVTGTNGTFLHKKDLNLAMNGDNMLDIKVQMSAGSGYGIFIYGKYTLAGVKGESTDYGQDYTRIPVEAVTTRIDGVWTVLTVDFSKVAEGYVLDTMEGFRLDIYGNGTLTHTYHSVESYRVEKCTVTYKGDVSKTESVEKGQPISGSAILGRKVEYFTDAACTTAFDVTTPVTSDTTIYVKLGTHVYFDGTQLNGFNRVGDPAPTVILNGNNTLTVIGPNGTFLHKKNLNLAMNGDNMLNIKVQMSAGSGYGIFIYGKYTAGGVAGESTDYGQTYTRIPENAITATADGVWTVLTVDFSKVAEGYVLDVMNGLRLDIYGNGTHTFTYHSVESYRSEKYTVTYKGDVNKTEAVEKGRPISGSAILGRKVEYFTDAACTTAYDVTSPITADTTIYVKIGDHVYFDGTQLNGFSRVGQPVPTVLLNDDNTLTVIGTNGTFLHKKNLNLAMNGDNMLAVKVKMSAGSGYGIYIYGKYTINGTAGESTDYGQAYTQIPESAVTATTEGGWTILTVDLGKIAEGYVLDVMNGLRLDINGNGTMTFTYHSVESYRSDKCTVTYKGDVTAVEAVEKGNTISGSTMLGYEIKYYTDEAYTQAFDPKTPITGDKTLYVKKSDYLYLSGADIKGNFSNTGAGTVNADNQLVIQMNEESKIFNWRTTYEQVNTKKFEIRFKLENHGSQVAFFTQGTLSNGNTMGETGVYYATPNDGWYTVTFDFGSKLTGVDAEAVIGTLTQFRFDVYGCTADTIITIDYIKTIPEARAFTVTYTGAVTGTEKVMENDTASGLPITAREELYFTDEACTIAYDLNTPVTGDITLYVKASEYLYISGMDVKYNFTNGAGGTLNEDGQLVLQLKSGSNVFNWRPSYTNVNTRKFEIRFKLENHGNQVAFFTQGTLSNGKTLGETGVYYATSADGWYTVTFDFTTKLASSGNGGAVIETLKQFRFDVDGCSTDTVLTIDYIKAVPEASAVSMRKPADILDQWLKKNGFV